MKIYFSKTATMDQREVIWIKEETNDVLPDLESVNLEDPLKTEELSLHIKEDTELKVCGDGSRHNNLEDPLKTEELSLHIKEDTELKVCGDGSRHNMVAPMIYALDSTRMVKNGAEGCGISFAESVNHGVNTDGLNKDAEEFHGSGSHKNIKFSEADVEASFLEDVEKQSASQETCIASQESFNVICNTQTVLHNAVLSDTNVNYLFSPTTSHVCSPPPVSLTKERPYKCNVCGKCFTNSSKLQSHTLILFGLKRHKCDTCGKSFTRPGNLKKHLLIHSGIKHHKCNTCGKTFTYLENLKKHLLIYSGIKHYKCESCGKSFTSLKALNKHALIHSRIKIPNALRQIVS